MINPYLRHQKNLKIEHLYPSIKGKCACGCGNLLIGNRKKWYSNQCRTQALKTYFIIKGDSDVIRRELFELEKGICRECGKYDNKWQADHILPVCKGGGGSCISNYQTLCLKCHKKKSILDCIPNSKNSLASGFDIFPSIMSTRRA